MRWRRRQLALVRSADRRRWRHLLVVAGAALFSSLAVLVSTRHGIGANGTDSVAYLTMADDVAAGRRPYPTVVGVPPTHLPPGWSLVVGLIVGIVPSAEALPVARALNVVFAGLLPLVIYAAVRHRSRRSTWIPALMAAVVATSYPLFELASRAVVEPMFLVLLVASLLAIDRLASVRTSAWLLVTSVLVGALILTRYVGAAALLPLGLVVIRIRPGWPLRLGWLGVVGLIAIAPTAAWYLLEPGSPESAHLRGDERAGLEELVLSIREAGITLVRGAYLPSVVQVAIGLALLSVPVVAVIVTGRAIGPDLPWRRRATDLVAARGLGPWLWFLVAYTPLVVLQRWAIDREIIARYWLPYWIVSAVVLGRCLIEWAVPARATWRRAIGVATASLVLLAAYNVVQVAITARSNARDGVTLNAVRYQESVALDALGEGDLDVILTDHIQLVEFQMYARGALVPIERLSCRVDRLDALVEDLEAAVALGDRPAVAVLRGCRPGTFVEELLARLDGAVVVRDPDLGVVIRPAG
jgi:hypothetical protein